MSTKERVATVRKKHLLYVDESSKEGVATVCKNTYFMWTSPLRKGSLPSGKNTYFMWTCPLRKGSLLSAKNTYFMRTYPLRKGSPPSANVVKNWCFLHFLKPCESAHPINIRFFSSANFGGRGPRFVDIPGKRISFKPCPCKF